MVCKDTWAHLNYEPTALTAELWALEHAHYTIPLADWEEGKYGYGGWLKTACCHIAYQVGKRVYSKGMLELLLRTSQEMS